MSIKPAFLNYDDSEWYKIMESKGVAWNKFAEKYGFFVEGEYQHYLCSLKGKIEFEKGVIHFNGKRKFINELQSNRRDTFFENLVLEIKPQNALQNADFIYAKSSLFLKLKLFLSKRKTKSFNGKILSCDSGLLATEILKFFNWAIELIDSIEYKNQTLTITFNLLPSEEKVLDLLYHSLEKSIMASNFK